MCILEINETKLPFYHKVYHLTISLKSVSYHILYLLFKIEHVSLATKINVKFQFQVKSSTCKNLFDIHGVVSINHIPAGKRDV